MTTMPNSAADRESRVRKLTQDMLNASREQTSKTRMAWEQRLFRLLMGDSKFRIQALRFVDVLPTLVSDRELIRHFREYFPLEWTDAVPGAVRWAIRRVHGTASAALVAPLIRASVKRVAHRFVSGENLAQALDVAESYHWLGMASTLDLLGEATVSEAEAEDYLQQYLTLLCTAPQVIAQWSSAIDEPVSTATFQLHLSIKVSSLYSQMSPLSTEHAITVLTDRLRPIFQTAQKQRAVLTLDMEQYEYKDIILGAFYRLLEEDSFRQWSDIGIAMQAYLVDTDHDIDRLIEWARNRGTPVTVRLVRGAYWDSETAIARREGWQPPVWQSKAETDNCFERNLEKLLAAHAVVRTAVATHNLRSLALAVVLAEEYQVPANAYEVQMLYGMAEQLRTTIAKQGVLVRVYLPFGQLLPGMAYLVRRLLENSSSQSMLRMLDPLQEEQQTGLQTAEAPGSATMNRSITTEMNGAAAGVRNEPLRRFVDASERERLAKALEHVRSQLEGFYHLTLGTESVATNSEILSRNPARPNEIVGRIASGTSSHADIAVDTALAAWLSWRELGFDGRVTVMRKLAEKLRNQRDELAAWEVVEAGKNWQEADADVAEAIDFVEYYAEQALRLHQGHTQDRAGETNHLSYHPLGLGVVIPPWNFPLAIPLGMLSAALVTGNAVILKPSSLTPVVLHRMWPLLAASGIPPGVAQLLPGSGGDVGEYLVKHPQVRFIAFTGSREVGLRINQLAAQVPSGQSHVKRVIAEMGGKNAIIVDEDADLDEAVSGILHSAFGFQGQKCSACSRVITVGSVHDLFVERLVEGARSLLLGDPSEPHSYLGPVIDDQALKRILQCVVEGRSAGKIVFEGDTSQLQEGYYLGPVIFDEVDPNSPLAQEEIFGPVLAIIRADDFNQALKLANETEYALTGGVYSRSPSHLEQAAKEFAVGNLYFNRKITHALVGCQPFGGYKMSGMGSKAGGPDYLHQFVLARSVTENTLRRGFAPDTD